MREAFPQSPAPQTSGPPATGTERRRERARRSLRWAYASVAFVLCVLFALAMAALWVGWRATEQQQRAEQAEERAESELEKTWLAEARGQRFGTTLARRENTLNIVRRAAAHQPSPALRDEAVAALALTDFQIESSITPSSGIRSVSFSPDLLTVAEGMESGDIVLRDLRAGTESARFTQTAGGIPPEQSGVALLTYSPDGTKLSARYGGGATAVWDIATGRPLLVHDTDKQRGPASLMHFSSDGRFVVGPVYRPQRGQAVLEVHSGRVVAEFPQFPVYRHVAVRPGFPMFAVSDGRNIVVINWETGEQVASFDFVPACRHLQWSNDGRYLGIAGNLLEVHVWDFEARTRQVFAGHTGDVHNIFFDPRGQLLATAAFDGLTRLWDLRSGRLQGVENGWVIRLGADGRIGMETYVTRRFSVHRLGPSPVYHRWPGKALQVEDMQAMDISPDGTCAATAVSRGGLRLWDLKKPGTAPVWYDYPGLDSVCFHPATGALIAGRADGPVMHDWRAASPDGQGLPGPSTPLRPMAGQRRNLVAVSLNGERVAGVNADAGFIHGGITGADSELFNITGKYNTQARASSSLHGTGTLSFSTDGRWLVCGAAGGEGTVAFDSATGKAVHVVDPEGGAVQFSPDGRWLTVCHNSRLQVVRASDWQTVWQETGIPRYAALTAAFSPDGNMVAAPDGAVTVAIWDTATGRRLCSLEAPEAVPITVLRWSADGRRLFCGLRDQNLEAWDIPALSRELHALGLGWDAAPALPAATAAVNPAANFPFKPLAAGVLITCCGASAIALLSLRRHRRLIAGIAHSESLALQRELDLESERQLSQLKDTFVSMVSHEFRTPLAVILSSAELLSNHLDRLTPEHRARQLESIRASTRRMAGLVEDVLLLGKIESGRMTFNPVTLPLAEFCETLVDESLSATNSRCPIQTAFVPPLPDTVSGDPSLLRHILGNILSNAVKYSPAGTPVEFTVTAPSTGLLRITISDKGIGIPDEDIPRLFQPFQRAANVGQISGTGLGLMIAKRCAERHGGTLELTSSVGKGTTVSVTLPVSASTLNH